MQQRVVLRTILVVGEGTSEHAFLTYLRSIYLTRGCGYSLTIKNGQGGGPSHVIARAIRFCQNQSYDIKGVLLDTDIAWDADSKKAAKSYKLRLIPCTPCFDGFMLRVLNQVVLQTSDECKARFIGLLNGSPTLPESYAELFPKDYLEQQRKIIPELDELLNLICGI